MTFRFLFLVTSFIAGANVSLHAQTTVSLTVDMTNEVVSPDGVHVAGNFQGWDPAATPMIDNGDGTWSHTFTSDTAATYQYIFVNGNAWGTHEGVPEACAYDGIRQIEVDGAGGEVSSLVCFGNCAACGMTTVRFRVDMANEEVSPFGVHVAGSFQGWDPSSTEMTDDDDDMVYETIQSFDASGADQIEFKFINGNNWTYPNELIDTPCGNEYGNRILDLDASDIVLSASGFDSPYCFSSCGPCVPPLAVTFNIDMSGVASVSENGVHLAGSFQGWDPSGTPLTEGANGFWSVTVEMEPGTYEFKFINGNDWSDGYENMEGTSCNNGGNRIATFDADNTVYAACFNGCPGDLCVPDPDPAEVTFRVNVTNQDLMNQSVFVWGSFTGWQGGAIEMTDADGDGVWEHTATISGSANVDYLYSLGHPNDQGFIPEDGVYGPDGEINFVNAGCGVPNAFGGFYRRHVRSGEAEVLDVVCFNTCNACPSSYGCTNLAACNYDPEASIDDGSCTFFCGCTDPEACNYDPQAEADDGSCCNCVSGIHPLPYLNQTWKFSSEAGAIAIGPEPGSTEWYASPEGGLVDFQYDDRWTFTPGGTMYYNNNGGTMNPFDGYVETVMSVEPTTYSYDPAGFLSLPSITIDPLIVDGGQEICGWVGTWDSGPEYAIVELTETTLVLSVLQQGGDCINPVGSGYFTLKFEASEPDTFVEENGLCLAGCLDEAACNYVAYAEYDDGSCDYSCQGCTDDAALNFDAEATVDDGSCVLISCDDVGSPLWDTEVGMGLHLPPSDVLMHGVEAQTEWIIHLPSVVAEPSSGQLFVAQSWSGLEVLSLPPGLTVSLQNNEVLGSQQLCVEVTGVPETPGVYMVQTTGLLTVSVFGSPFEIGTFTTETTVEVLANPNPIPGCAYVGALNYVSYADVDNGTCLYAGCTDPEALNYYPFITLDDGSCLYGDVVGPTCPSDIDQDGAVTTSDLLTLLSTFGLDCE